MRGRKPLPTALKIARGCRPCRVNKHEPRPEPVAPKMPGWLDREARRKWKQLAAMLSTTGVLTVADGEALTMIAVAWSRFVRAEASIKETGGEVVRSPSGQPVANPYMAIRNKAAEELTRLLIEFGLTPSSRSRVHAAPAKNPASTSKQQKFFGGA